MPLATTPCTMCGTTGYTRTRQHILRREWRDRYPWINSPQTRLERRLPDGTKNSELRDVDFLNQQVGPFCGRCNHVFMNGIERDAVPAIHRLLTKPSLTIHAREIEPLRRWIYLTTLVRSLLDRSAGLSAPTEWFRAFHASGGEVPPSANFLIARVDSWATIHPLRMHGANFDDDDSVTWILDCALMFGGLLIVTGIHGSTDEETRRWAQLPYRMMDRAYDGRLRQLAGTSDIHLTAPLGWREVPYVVAPTNRLTGPADGYSDDTAVPGVHEDIESQDRFLVNAPWAKHTFLREL